MSLDSTRRTVRMARVAGRMVWRVAKPRAVVWTAVSVVGVALAPVLPYLSKHVVDAVAASSRTAIIFAVFYLVAALVQRLALHARGALTFDVGDRVSHAFEQQVLDAGMRAGGLEHLERPDYADKMQAARNQSQIPGNFVMTASNRLFNVLGIASSSVLLILIDPLLVLTVVLMLPGAVLVYRSERRRQERRLQLTADERLEQHYVARATAPQFAHEVRVFGIGPRLVDRYQALSARRSRLLVRDQLKHGFVGAGSGFLQGLAPAVGIGYLVWLAVRGAASPGEVVMGAQVLLTLVGQVGTAVSQTGQAAQFAFLAETFLWLLDYVSPVTSPREPVSVPVRIQDGIRFENVTFAYPGTDSVVLRDISLEIPAGITVAIVGDNGVGKTTIAKLLCRFYDPTSGRITVDGVDLRHLDLDAWRERSTAVFQDYASYHVLARESIGVGSLPMIADREAVLAAARRGGAEGIVTSLPQGLETQLGREYPSGVEISEGQRQRLALSRGSMRTTPAVVILDEPTASLDAKAEADVFSRFADMSTPLEGERPVTIVISHRFSTVRMADVIVVLDEGRLVEVGSHEELMRKGGLYAELYTLQASAYRS